MALATSDWVTITTTAVSVIVSALVSVGIAIWQTKKSVAPMESVAQSHQIFASSTWRWLFAQLWPFLGSGIVSLVILAQAVGSEGPVTRSFVISLVFGSFLLGFSVLSSLAFVVAAAFRPAYLLLQKLDKPSSSHASPDET